MNETLKLIQEILFFFQEELSKFVKEKLSDISRTIDTSPIISFDSIDIIMSPIDNGW